MNKLKYLLLTTAVCLTPVTYTAADELIIPVGSQAQSEEKTQRPSSGMTGEHVLAKFGEPENTSETIGDPPITVWNYANYSVYFEYNHVIHTVFRATL